MRMLAFLVFALVQNVPEADVSAGDRVRITRSGEDLVGLVETVSAEALTLKLDDEPRAAMAIPLSEITGLQISRGERTRGAGAWHKTKWGALVGAASGTILLGLQHEQVGEDGSSVGEAAALGAFSGGLFGGLIGAAIGAMNPGERWEKLSPTFQMSTRKDGFSFSATIGF